MKQIEIGGDGGLTMEQMLKSYGMAKDKYG